MRKFLLKNFYTLVLLGLVGFAAFVYVVHRPSSTNSVKKCEMERLNGGELLWDKISTNFISVVAY